MELLEFKNRIFSLFGVNDINEFSDALMKCVSEYDESMISGYEEIVGSDFSEDWMQKLFQYYAADRKGAKQDFTPKSLARLVSALADEGEIVDQCALALVGVRSEVRISMHKQGGVTWIHEGEGMDEG